MAWIPFKSVARARMCAAPAPARTGASSGAGSVEYVGLVAVVALIALAALSALASSPEPPAARALAAALARRLACAPRHPVPCNRNPLALAYGFPIGKLVRSLAPGAASLGASGLVPVDFRRCRWPSCAAPSAEPGLTASRRRVTLFTWVDDRRRSGGEVRIEYWAYVPSIGWRSSVLAAGPAEIEAASALRLRLTDTPALVPLETLPGRDHYAWARSELPPWLWRSS